MTTRLPFTLIPLDGEPFGLWLHAYAARLALSPGHLAEALGIPGRQGATIAIVLWEAFPNMLADANRFFASQGVAGFASGQYTENYDSGWASTCGVLQSQPEPNLDPEEALDVETAHIAAPDAKVVLVAADCDPSGASESPLDAQDLLDATTRVVDSHLADVVSGSYAYQLASFSPADVAAWNLVFQQGAVEGIGFDYSSGDGASGADPGDGIPASVLFPAADPWVTAVGGTTLAIGKDGTAIADYPWNDNLTQVDSAGTGYTPPLPGDLIAGSGGGVSALFAEPGYQKPVVPTALATSDGTTSAGRVVPDISANAGASLWIGYTGAVTTGVYNQILEGGTSASSPLMAGLEVDAMQAAGHAIGFANPALYKLDGTPAISDVAPVNPDDPPMLIGDSIYFGPGDYLDTIGEAQPPLVTTNGYDDTTGIGAPGDSFLTAFTRVHTCGLGRAAFSSSGHRPGLQGINPARTAPFSAARSVAWIRCSVAALTGRPSAVSSRAIAVNMSCTSPAVSAASGMPPRYGTR